MKKLFAWLLVFSSVSLAEVVLSFNSSSTAKDLVELTQTADKTRLSVSTSYLEKHAQGEPGEVLRNLLMRMEQALLQKKYAHPDSPLSGEIKEINGMVPGRVYTERRPDGKVDAKMVVAGRLNASGKNGLVGWVSGAVEIKVTDVQSGTPKISIKRLSGEHTVNGIKVKMENGLYLHVDVDEIAKDTGKNSESYWVKYMQAYAHERTHYADFDYKDRDSLFLYGIASMRAFQTIQEELNDIKTNEKEEVYKKLSGDKKFEKGLKKRVDDLKKANNDLLKHLEARAVRAELISHIIYLHCVNERMRLIMNEKIMKNREAAKEYETEGKAQVSNGQMSVKKYNDGVAYYNRRTNILNEWWNNIEGKVPGTDITYRDLASLVKVNESGKLKYDDSYRQKLIKLAKTDLLKDLSSVTINGLNCTYKAAFESLTDNPVISTKDAFAFGNFSLLTINGNIRIPDDKDVIVPQWSIFFNQNFSKPKSPDDDYVFNVEGVGKTIADGTLFQERGDHEILLKKLEAVKNATKERMVWIAKHCGWNHYTENVVGGATNLKSVSLRDFKGNETVEDIMLDIEIYDRRILMMILGQVDSPEAAKTISENDGILAKWVANDTAKRAYLGKLAKSGDEETKAEIVSIAAALNRIQMVARRPDADPKLVEAAKIQNELRSSLPGILNNLKKKNFYGCEKMKDILCSHEKIGSDLRKLR